MFCLGGGGPSLVSSQVAWQATVCVGEGEKVTSNAGCGHGPALLPESPAQPWQDEISHAPLPQANRSLGRGGCTK